MAFLVCVLLLAVTSGQGSTRPVDQDDSLLAVVSGTFYALDSLHGRTHHHRLSRRHLQLLSNKSRAVHALRLDLGPEVRGLEMEVSQDSVWTDQSQLLVRRGEEVEVIQDAVDASCFLTGPLTSQGGAVSLHTCGRLTGMIQAGDIHYEIEEAAEASNETGDGNVKVTMRKAKDTWLSLDDELAFAQSGLEEKELGSNTSKRQNDGPITAEIGLFLDANFAKHMRRTGGKRTEQAITSWLIMKWNIVRGVYGNARKVGLPFSLQVKNVEIWRENPDFYQRLGNGAPTVDYLRTFCRESSNTPNYDHKMLYTQGTGGHHMGMAYTRGRDRKCSLVKSKTDSVWLELHEFGHSVGFNHDPSMPLCTSPTGDGGFMGWSQNYEFLDCYRRRLLQTIRTPGAHCLYETNVNRHHLNH